MNILKYLSSEKEFEQAKKDAHDGTVNFFGQLGYYESLISCYFIPFDDDDEYYFQVEFYDHDGSIKETLYFRMSSEQFVTDFNNFLKSFEME